MRMLVILILTCLNAVAHAQEISTRAALDAILDDQARLEDFEGFSLAGGSWLTAPNPLNADTQLPGWGILAGPTYSSPAWLRFYTTSMYGDDSNVLAGSNDLFIVFDEPQLAVGFDIVSITANLTYHDTVTFYNDTTPIGSISRDIAPGGELFVGWQNAAGITSIRVIQSGTSGWAIVDNIEWGVRVQACAPDLNLDAVLDFFDVQQFLAGFSTQARFADWNHDGRFDFFDVQLFLADFAAGCP